MTGEENEGRVGVGVGEHHRTGALSSSAIIKHWPPERKQSPPAPYLISQRESKQHFYITHPHGFILDIIPNRAMHLSQQDPRPKQ